MGRNQALILLLIILFTSCISFYQHPVDGTLRPKKPKFSLANKKNKFNKLIDTVAIYTSIDTFKYSVYKSVSFLKFYNNGRMFASSKKIPSLLTEYTLKPSEIGYYFLKDNKIETEYYFVDPLNKYETEYIKQKGFIKGDTIFLRNSIDTNYVEKYIKEKLNFVPKPSNW